MLGEILESVHRRLAASAGEIDGWRAAADAAAPPRDFAGALTCPGLSVIAEVKRRSPSVGDIDPDLDPAKLSVAYRAGGAAAVSVLTEPDHFGALPGDLGSVRAAVDLPVLRKDFILGESQIAESRALGADAVLLIVAVLDDETLAGLIAAAADRGMGCLVEVHTAAEAERALAAGATTIGVNNRDLATFRVDLGTAEAIRPLLGTGVVTVAESGVATPGAAARMAAAGYDAILVGEAAVRSHDPAAFVSSLRGTP